MSQVTLDVKLLGFHEFLVTFQSTRLPSSNPLHPRAQPMGAPPRVFPLHAGRLDGLLVERQVELKYTGNAWRPRWPVTVDSTTTDYGVPIYGIVSQPGPP